MINIEKMGIFEVAAVGILGAVCLTNLAAFTSQARYTAQIQDRDGIKSAFTFNNSNVVDRVFANIALMPGVYLGDNFAERLKSKHWVVPTYKNWQSMQTAWLQTHNHR